MDIQNKNTPKFRPNPALRLMDQVREVLRYYHYASRTEQAYCQWIRRYIHYYGGNTHPDRLGAQDVERFLSHLATEGKVSASTQRQALNALVFLYRDVLLMPLTGHLAPVRSKRQPRPPTVLTQGEVQRLLAALSGTHALMAKLLYGAGLRLLECLRLRVQDVDFGQNLIFVRGGKGGRDRATLLPQHLREELQGQIERAKALHHHDLEEGFGAVYLPEALARKYPRAARETGWQWVFQHGSAPAIPARDGSYGIMCWNLAYKRPSNAWRRKPVSTSESVAILCGTLRHNAIPRG